MPYNPDLSNQSRSGPTDPSPDHVNDSQYVLNEIKRLTNPLLWSVFAGQAYRVSLRHTMDDTEELTIYFEPVAAGGTIHIAPPAIESPEAANVDVWENPADPSENFAGDVFVHNMRYDAQESPEATIDRVTTGNLTTTSADQTEESLVRAGDRFNSPLDVSQRGIWRTIPVGETIAMVITDQSGGANNLYSFDTVVYEGDILPD